MFYKFIFVITRPGSSRQFFRVWKGTVLLLSGQMRGFREFNVLMTQNLISLNIRIFVTLFYRVLVDKPDVIAFPLDRLRNVLKKLGIFSHWALSH